MKKITMTIAIAVALSAFLPGHVNAQTPQAFKYQAVVRDNAGDILSNTSVSLRMGIRDGSASGTVVYRETHSAITNQFGLVNIEIGNGTPGFGTFFSIDWGFGTKYLETELDPAGGTNYTSMGTAQLMSVPYALYAETAENVDDADADPGNELQTLSISGSDLSISDGNMVTLPASSGDNLGNHTATQNIELSGKWLSNDGGNEGIFVSTGGNVGIGSNNPLADLDVNGNIIAADGLQIYNAPEKGVSVTSAGNPSGTPFSPEKNGFDIAGAEGYGLFVGQADMDGVHVYKTGNPSTYHISSADNGFEVAGAEGNGLYVGRADDNGVLINETGGTGLHIGNAGGSGVSVTTAQTHGVYVGDAQATGFYINNAGQNGVAVGDATFNGFYVGNAGNDGGGVYHAGNPSTQHSSTEKNGFEVEGAEGNGLYVGRADENGIRIKEAGDFGMWMDETGSTGLVIGDAGGNGISIGNTIGKGIDIFEAGSDGVYVYNAGNPSTQFISSLKNGIEICGAEDNGVYVGQADDDGLHIYKAGSPSSTSISSYDNGVEIEGAARNGVWIGHADYHGVVVNDADGSGVYVTNAGSDGIFVNNAGNPSTQSPSVYENNGFEVAGAEDNGLYVGQADQDGVHIKKAGTISTTQSSTLDNGFEVEGASGNGLYVGRTNQDGVHIYKAGSPSGTSTSSSDNGVEIEGAAGYGMYVGYVGSDGIYIKEVVNDGIQIKEAGNPSTTHHSSAKNGIEVEGAEGYGLYVGQADVDGVYIYSASDDGLWVNNAGDRALYSRTTDASNEWGLYTPDKVHAYNVTSKGNSSYAKNTGSSTLEPGDIVCIAGGLEKNVLDGAGFPVVNIAKATKENSQAVFGVVEYKVSIREETEEAPEGETPELKKSFEHADGNVMPGDYLSVVVFGQAEVKVSGNEPIKAGDPLVAGNGSARKVQTREIEGITIAENTGILGKALENSNGKGMVTVFVNCK